MSAYVWKPCACGVNVVSISADEDDIRVAVAAHNDLPAHQQWRAVQVLKNKGRRHQGPCICKGGRDRDEWTVVPETAA